MGFIRNHLYKTAIKQSLLDLTKGVESLQRNLIKSVSFGEAVKMLSEHEYYKPYLDSGELNFRTWEQCFFGMVLIETKRQMEPGQFLFEGNKNHNTLLRLVNRWIVPYGGDPHEVLKLYSSNINDEASDKTEISRCPHCSRRIRIPIPPPSPRATCNGCNKKFRVSYDGQQISLSMK